MGYTGRGALLGLGLPLFMLLTLGGSIALFIGVRGGIGGVSAAEVCGVKFDGQNAPFEKKYAVTSFSRLHIGSRFDVVVRPGATCGVTLRAQDARMQDSLQLSVEDGRLTVVFGDPDRRGYRSDDDDAISELRKVKGKRKGSESRAQLVVEMPLVEAISGWGIFSLDLGEGLRYGRELKIALSGMVALQAHSAELPGSLSVDVSGISGVVWGNLQVAEGADIELEGLGSLEGDGLVVGGRTLELEASGMSSFTLGGVECVNLDLECSGMSKGRIKSLAASANATVVASGMSSVRIDKRDVKGSFNKESSGFSSIK